MAGRPLRRLLDGGTRTTARWAVPIALAGVGVVARSGGSGPLEIGLVAWTVAAVPVFLVQHWWIYQYAMVLVPLGSSRRTVSTHPSRRPHAPLRRDPRRAVLLSVRSTSGSSPTSVTRRHRGAIARRPHRAARRGRAELRRARAWSAHLEPSGRPTRRVRAREPARPLPERARQSVAINGWSPEQYPDSVWRRLRAQLRAARPDEIVVDRFSRRIMRDRSPQTLALIRRD